MARQVRPNRDPGRVGILASSSNHAATLAQDFGVHKPLCFSPRSLDKLRGHDLRVLLVDQDSWPPTPEVLAQIRPALARHAAYVYKLARHDLHRRTPLAVVR